MVDHNLKANWVTPVPITHIAPSQEGMRQEILDKLRKKMEEETSKNNLDEDLFYHKIMLLLTNEKMNPPPVLDALTWPIYHAPMVVSG